MTLDERLYQAFDDEAFMSAHLNARSLTDAVIGILADRAGALDPIDVCNALASWAEVAGIPTGKLAVVKSDLLNRLIYGRERGPSKTPCPVHKGIWMGCHSGWPGSVWRNFETGAVTPMEVDARLQEWHDAGCRCYQHKGSSCTTGWNPDEHCCLEATT